MIFIFFQFTQVSEILTHDKHISVDKEGPVLVGDLTLVHGSVFLLRSEDDYSVIKHFVIGREIWGENKLELAPKVLGETWVICHMGFYQSRSSLYAGYTRCVGPPKHQGAPLISKMF